ncbi:AzlC family ABC transporter permease, partial [uncultured Tessaracoccus sp.]|uniref:AzlC family ABC transporter permease n=1 Tax=uncultured Tessaracoccus sp. TaxID=905023 RepID=UPI00260386BB
MTFTAEAVGAKIAGVRNRDALEVARLSLGGGLGLIPLGIAFGMMVIQAGFPWWVAPVLSVVVYTGSVELLLVSLIAAGTPVLTVGLTVLLVNV